MDLRLIQRLIGLSMGANGWHRRAGDLCLVSITRPAQLRVPADGVEQAAEVLQRADRRALHAEMQTRGRQERSMSIQTRSAGATRLCALGQ